MYDYFFSGDQYIRVTRADTGPGSVDPGYPRSISENWGWGEFGAGGIDAALYSGSKCYFFSGDQYIRVTRGETGPGSVDPGYPAPISSWGWGEFGAGGIDAALYSGSKCYFFSGDQYIRVTRGETGPGTVDVGYPRPISVWGWGEFGASGIDAALYSGAVCYFFSGGQYVRVHRADEGAGRLDPGYPRSISGNWGWGSFGADGIDAALYSGGPLVAPPPATGLVSNYNYFFEQGGQALVGVSVTINFDTDFVSAANGFSFQLNGYSKSGEEDGAQQIVVLMKPETTELIAWIENWVTKTTELVLVEEGMAKLPSSKIPAGYSIKIALETDADQSISGASFAVSDENGHSIGTKVLSIPVTDRAPITAFQMNIGGDYNKSRAKLTSASGTITYAADTPMAVVNAPPDAYIDFEYHTAENANLVFGQLPVAPHQAVTQSFRATTTDAALAAVEAARAKGPAVRSPS
jgi:hypothetical protein